MATLTFTHDNITLTSAWRTTTGSNGKPQYLQSPTLVYANPTFNVTGIPSNAVINSAKVYFTWGAPSFTDVSALFANVITRIHHNQSIGDLLDNRNIIEKIIKAQQESGENAKSE